MAAIKAPINMSSLFMRESSLRPKDKYGPRPKGIGAQTRGLRKLRKRLLTSRSPGTRLRAQRAQRMGTLLRPACAGLRRAPAAGGCEGENSLVATAAEGEGAKAK